MFSSRKQPNFHQTKFNISINTVLTLEAVGDTDSTGGTLIADRRAYAHNIPCNKGNSRIVQDMETSARSIATVIC
jgi:hypothetical protein